MTHKQEYDFHGKLVEISNRKSGGLSFEMLSSEKSAGILLISTVAFIMVKLEESVISGDSGVAGWSVIDSTAALEQAVTTFRFSCLNFSRSLQVRRPSAGIGIGLKSKFGHVCIPMASAISFFLCFICSEFSTCCRNAAEACSLSCFLQPNSCSAAWIAISVSLTNLSVASFFRHSFRIELSGTEILE